MVRFRSHGLLILISLFLAEVVWKRLHLVYSSNPEEPRFVESDDGSLFLQFLDEGQVVHVPVPAHLAQLSGDEMLDGVKKVVQEYLEKRMEDKQDDDPKMQRDQDEEAKQFHHPKDQRNRELMVLKQLFRALVGQGSTPASTATLLTSHGRWWLNVSVDHCLWHGVTCGIHGSSRRYASNVPPSNLVTSIELPYMQLGGSLPDSLIMLEFLTTLDLRGNGLHGTIPDKFAHLSHLEKLDLSQNLLNGTIPLFGGPDGAGAAYLEYINLYDNFLVGQLPANLPYLRRLTYLDLSRNSLTGTLSSTDLDQLSALRYLLVGENPMSGSLPATALPNLKVLYAASCLLSGKIPASLPPDLQDLYIADNFLSGTLPAQLLGLSKLQTLIVSDNFLSGAIPHGDDKLGTGRSVLKREKTGYLWANLQSLGLMLLNRNKFIGTLPPELHVGLKASLKHLDVSQNELTGTIPPELGQMRLLHTIDAMSNKLRGTLPQEMLRMNRNLRLNFTDNLLTGTIPGMFCGYGASHMSMLYREYGCDAVLCRAGTFNIHGHATLHSACRDCPPTPEGEAQNPPLSIVLGRTSCEGVMFVHGDLNGDGILSPREILRMIFIDNLGRFWGASFKPWADMSYHECHLPGVKCENGRIVAIDLTGAHLCSDGDRKPAPVHFCNGLPAEIGELGTLESLRIAKQAYLRGTIPTEIGDLSKLQVLDFSNSHSLSGTLPSELGNLSRLKHLIFAHSHLGGTIPTEIFSIPTLEKLDLTHSGFTNQIPSEVGKAAELKELLVSRNFLTGPIPTEIGLATNLENFEAYYNSFNGSLPSELALCTNLKRIDVFHNQLSGGLPEELASVSVLQIIHLKQNRFTGTIASAFGNLPYLTWLDLSHNSFQGTIPTSFGSSTSLKDFRLAQNMIYEPIPHGLCTNLQINGGVNQQYGCDGVVCSLGTYSDMGHALEGVGCIKCPEGETTLYLGSTACQPLTVADILSIFFEVMDGERWPEDMRLNWGNRQKHPCEWGGIVCNNAGEPVSLSFPRLG